MFIGFVDQSIRKVSKTSLLWDSFSLMRSTETKVSVNGTRSNDVMCAEKTARLSDESNGRWVGLGRVWVGALLPVQMGGEENSPFEK